MQLNQSTKNQYGHESWKIVYITGYSVLFGVIISCNIIAIVAGFRRYKKCKHESGDLRNRSELTRCSLLIYLAILDILLCLTIPMISIDLLSIHWPFNGSQMDWICPYTKVVPAVVMYATSTWIILIAVDSYRNICHALRW